MSDEFESPSPYTQTAAQLETPRWTLGDIAKGIGIVVGIVIVFGTILGIVAVEIAGSADAVDDDPDALAVQLLASFPLQFAMVGVSLYFAGKYGLSWKSLGVRMPERGSWWLAFALYGAIMLLAIVYAAVVDTLFGLPETELPSATFEKLAPALVAGILAVGLAPVCEEIFFRGFVFGGLNERGQLWIAAVGSGMLFGLAHLLNPGGYATFPVIAGIGAILAYGYHYSGSILPCMGAHFIFNLQSYAYQAATA